MSVFQKNDEQFVIRSDDYKIIAYVAIAFFVLGFIVQVFSLRVFYKFYKTKLHDT